MKLITAFSNNILWRSLYFISSFFLTILISREYQAAFSGSVFYITSVYALINLILSFSLESSLNYFGSAGSMSIGKLLNFSLLWSIIAAIIIFILSFFFTPNTYMGFDKKFIIFSAITFVFGNLVITYCGALFSSQTNFVFPNVVSILINLCLIIIFPYNANSIFSIINYNNFFYAYFGSFLINGIVLIIALKVKYSNKQNIRFLNFTELTRLMKYSGISYVANIIFFFLYRIDYWFVKQYCTPEQLGNYIQVSKLGQLFFILPTILAGAIFPFVVNEKQRVNNILCLLSRLIVFLYTLICLFLILFGKLIFSFVFGKSFSGIYQPFLFLIPGIISLSGLYTVTAYNAGKNKMEINIKGSSLALIYIVIFDALFVPRYGIIAAAINSSISYIIFQSYVLINFKKEYKSRIIDFFIIKISDFKFLYTKFNKL